MLNLLTHFYMYAETYTLLLTWVVVPLAVRLVFLRFASLMAGLATEVSSGPEAPVESAPAEPVPAEHAA